MKAVVTLAAVLASSTWGCWKAGTVSPAGSCVALGFGAWSGRGPEGFAAGSRNILPHFKLTSDRTWWPRSESWYVVQPLGPREPIGQAGREVLTLWLAPRPDSLILFRVGETPWTLRVSAVWQRDIFRGRAYYREGGSRRVDSQANAYGVRYDCSTFHAVQAANALADLLARDVPRPDDVRTPAVWERPEGRGPR